MNIDQKIAEWMDSIVAQANDLRNTNLPNEPAFKKELFELLGRADEALSDALYMVEGYDPEDWKD